MSFFQNFIHRFFKRGVSFVLFRICFHLGTLLRASIVSGLGLSRNSRTCSLIFIHPTLNIHHIQSRSGFLFGVIVKSQVLSDDSCEVGEELAGIDKACPDAGGVGGGIGFQILSIDAVGEIFFEVLPHFAGRDGEVGNGADVPADDFIELWAEGHLEHRLGIGYLFTFQALGDVIKALPELITASGELGLRGSFNHVALVVEIVF